MSKKEQQWQIWFERFDERRNPPPSGWRQFLDVSLSKAEWFDRYKLYLRSSAWQLRRAGVLRREQMCQLCQATERLEVHHVTYVNVGSEPIEDLRCLCHRCHKKVDSRGDKWVPMSPALREARDRKRHLAALKAAKKKQTRRRPQPPPDVSESSAIF